MLGCSLRYSLPWGTWDGVTTFQESGQLGKQPLFIYYGKWVYFNNDEIALTTCLCDWFVHGLQVRFPPLLVN